MGPDLSLIKAASPTAVAVGGDISFAMAVTNNGPGAASGVQVSDTLPAGLELVSISASQGSCGGTTCSLGSIAENGSATVSLVARATVTGHFVNTASVSQSAVDPLPTNGTSQAAVNVSAGEPPSLPPPTPGEVNVTPAGGQGQCVALKDGDGVCSPLDAGQQIDLSDIAYINPGAGVIELQGIEGVGVFFGTPFGLQEINATSQSRRIAATQPRPILIIKLLGGSYKQCGKARSVSGVAALDVQVAKRKPIRRLWGKGQGRFRTRGRYSSGTVRGTNWLTKDFCEGTLTRVVEGVVSVHDLVTDKYIRVTAGKRYFTKAGPLKKPKK
jgi:uncharacterized repeat protein (TIGR01451 family)